METVNLSRYLQPTLERDAMGRIIPTSDALAKIEKAYAEKPDAEKWRLAQAQTMIDWHEANRPT